MLKKTNLILIILFSFCLALSPSIVNSRVSSSLFVFGTVNKVLRLEVQWIQRQFTDEELDSGLNSAYIANLIVTANCPHRLIFEGLRLRNLGIGGNGGIREIPILLELIPMPEDTPLLGIEQEGSKEYLINDQLDASPRMYKMKISTDSNNNLLDGIWRLDIGIRITTE